MERISQVSNQKDWTNSKAVLSLCVTEIWLAWFLFPKNEHRLLLFRMITLGDRKKVAQASSIQNWFKGRSAPIHFWDELNIRISDSRVFRNFIKRFVFTNDLDQCNCLKLLMIKTFNDPHTNEFVIDFLKLWQIDMCLRLKCVSS